MPWQRLFPAENTYAFVNLTHNPIITHIFIFLGGYKSTIIKTSNRSVFDRIVEQIVLRGLPISVVDDDDGQAVMLDLPHSILVPGLVFQAIQAIELSFEEIREYINGILSINLLYMPPIPPHFFLMAEETKARDMINAHADHAWNDIIRQRNVRFRMFTENDTCNICLTNPPNWMCNEYNIINSIQPIMCGRRNVCNACDPILRGQILSNGMPKYQNWTPYVPNAR